MENLGITVKEGCDAYVAYRGTNEFETLKAFFGKNWRDDVTIDTDFTESERAESAFLSIGAAKMLGYPQPEDYDEDEGEEEPEYPFDIYPYYENVFEVAGTSPDYGMLRGKQIGNFSFLGEPRWGKSGIGSIFWSGDNFFVTPEAYHAIFEPLTIASRPVLKYKTKQPLKTVLQIIPQGAAKAKLIIPEELVEETSIIPEWNMTKCILKRQGYYPSFETNPGDYDFFESKEYFGPGGVTEKELFISQRLYQQMKAHNIKGLKYYPQASNG